MREREREREKERERECFQVEWRRDPPLLRPPTPLLSRWGIGAARLSTASSYGTFAHLSPSVSGGIATPVPRIGVINVPPILVLPTDSGFSAVGNSESFLERGRGNLLSPTGHQTPFGARKSPTLLQTEFWVDLISSVLQQVAVWKPVSEQSRNSSGSPRPRPVKKVHFIKNMRQYDTRGSSSISFTHLTTQYSQRHSALTIN
ncbi:hypothetical protein JZ751_014615 [Albula glossodonta]|uniref:Uncharacterized protein n=1 Tax=Albula glossodonta TaxID=121402 RepID=A0A8T2N7P4_9TELE|nr:hypothetical protein JZ751_014615 [Albula glossodonta]